MGNAAGKRVEEAPRVDGGYVFPTGTIYKTTDADLRVVRRLITERKLAPFYIGTDAETEDYTVECPICFMYLPSNLNNTRCCGQLVCTECFLQIKHPAAGGAAVCPFCVQPEFGVIYRPPGLEGAPQQCDRKVAIPHNAPGVVTVDRVKPGARRPAPMPRMIDLARRNTVTATRRNVPIRRTTGPDAQGVPASSAPAAQRMPQSEEEGRADFMLWLRSSLDEVNATMEYLRQQGIDVDAHLAYARGSFSSTSSSSSDESSLAPSPPPREAPSALAMATSSMV